MSRQVRKPRNYQNNIPAAPQWYSPIGGRRILNIQRVPDSGEVGQVQIIAKETSFDEDES